MSVEPTRDYPTSVSIRRVEILRAGTYTDMNGRTFPATQDNMRQVVANYDPALYKARLKTGHSDSDTVPAEGGVSAVYLSEDGTVMYADIEDVPPDVARDMLDSGRYPSRSAEFYANLQGKGMYLKALSRLGARPPAVKGMSPIKPDQLIPVYGQPVLAFADGEETLTLSYLLAAEPPAEQINKEVEKPMAETTETTAAVQDMEAVLKLAEMETKLAEAEAEKAKTAEQVAFLLAEQAKSAAEKRKSDADAFIAKLTAEERCTPGMVKAGLGEVLQFADALDDGVIKLAEGGVKPLGEVLRGVLLAMPKVLPGDKEVAPVSHTPDDTETYGLSERQRKLAKAAGLTYKEYADELDVKLAESKEA